MYELPDITLKTRLEYGFASRISIYTLLDAFRTNSRDIIGRNPSMVIPLLANQDLTPMLRFLTFLEVPHKCISSVCQCNVMSGFIVKTENLEHLENRPFYEKLGKTWNSQGNFCNIYPSQGKVTEVFLDASKAVPKVVLPFAVSNCKRYHFHFLCLFLHLCDILVRDKVGSFKNKSGKSHGSFLRRIQGCSQSGSSICCQ